MKKILAILFVMGLFNSVSAQNTMQVYYAYKNYTLKVSDVNTSVSDNQIIYKDSTCVVFLIAPDVAPKLSGGGFKGFALTVDNATDKLCEVLLDECFVIYNGTSIPIADAHMLRINIDQSSGILNIPPRSKAKKELYQKVKDENDIVQLIRAETLSFYITYKFKGDEETKSVSINCTIERLKK